MPNAVSTTNQFFLLVLTSFFFINLFSISAFAVKDKEYLTKQENEAKELIRNWTLDSYIKAISKFEQNGKDWEILGDYSKAVISLNEAAKLAQITSDYQTSFRLLNRAIKIAENNNLLVEKTISMSLYSLVSRQKGQKIDIDNSLKYSTEAVSLSHSLDSPSAKAYANLSAGIHNFYHGKFDLSKEQLEIASTFSQQTQEIDLIVQSLLFNGYAAGRDGNSIKGLQSIQLALIKSNELDYQRGKALSNFGMGYLNMLLNEKQKAIFFFQKAEELFPADFEWLERAKLYNNLGVICEEYGNYEMGELYREKGYLFNQKANYLLGEIATLPSLARIKMFKGDYEGSKELYEKMITLSLENKNKFHKAVGKEGLGNIEFQKGNFDSALKYYQETLSIYDEIGIKLPRIENFLGKVLEKKGDFIAAKSFYTRALNINFQTKDHLAASENLYNLANLSFLEGNAETSFEQINKSIEITENLYSDIVNSSLKRSYFSNVYDRYELLIHLLMQKFKQTSDTVYAIQALQVSEKSRSRYMLENLRLSEAQFTKDANPELINREKEIRRHLNRNVDILTELISRKSPANEISQLENEIFTLENELEDIKGKLKQESPIYTSIKNPSTFDLSSFQKQILDKDSLFLEFSLGEKESYLWVISNKEHWQFTLPSRRVIEERVEKMRKTFDGRQQLPNEEPQRFQERISDLEKIFNQEAKLLSLDLFGQMDDKLRGKKLIIVTDGKLSFLPISALSYPNTDDLLITQNEVIYQPSGSFLSVLENLHKTNQIPSKDLLIFADPVFSDIDNRLLTKNPDVSNKENVLGSTLREFRLFDSEGKIPRLFATQEEAEAIAKAVGKTNTKLVSGFAANREQVLNPEIKDYKILHFATHGLIDVNRPEVSSIVLSQFDENGQKLEGFLRLQDIYSLDLASDLVVLSACQSGIGKEFKGEGLMSLSNGFLQAGAKTVVSTAWKVDDNATSLLMQHFYNNLIQKRLTPSDSLRKAQLELMQNPQFKSPFYWAAFTVQGEFRKPISVSYYPYYFKVGLLLLLAGVGVYWFLRKKKNYWTAK